MSGCGGNIVAGCCPGPQGPPGPTGPTGPGGGGTAGVGVSIGGNTAGAPSLISTGTLVLAGGNNVTLSQNGQSISFSAGQSTQTQAAGSIAGIGVSSATQAGSTLGVTLSTNGLSLAVPQWITGGGGVDVSMGGNTAGVAGLISTGTLVLAGGNNVTLSQNGNSITISANTAAAANLSVSAGSTTGAFGGLTFGNGSNVTFGLNNGTITASVLAQSTQTQASGNIAGVGTTFNGANVSGSMTLNSAGLNLSLSAPVETGIGLSAAGSSQAAGTVVLSNANGVSFGMVGSTVTASVAAAGGGLDVTLGGNTSGALALISTGTLFLAGGNNVTLSQNGNSVTISANTAAAANLSVSAGTTTGAFGGLTFSNSNNISFGLNNGTITGSANAPGLGTTFAGANISGSMTLNTAGLNLSLSGPSETGVGISAAGSSQTAGNIVFSNSNGVTFGMAGSTVTASVAGGGGATTGAAFLQGNTTGQSSSSSYALSSLNVSGAGIISAGWSASTLIISAPGTTGFSLSAFAVSNTTQSSSGTVAGSALSFAGAGGVSVGVTNGSVVISGGAAGGVSTAGLFALGNTTQNSSTTLNLSALSFNGLGEITVGYSNGSIQVSAPAQSLGVSNIGNTSGNTGSYSGQLVFAGGNNITLSVSSGAGGAQTITISGANAGGAQTGISGIQVSNTTLTVGTVTLQNANGISFGSSGANGISASANFGVAGLQASNTTLTSGTITLQNANGISFGSSGANGISASYTVPTQSNQTLGLYALGNTTQNSSTTLDGRTLSFDALGAMTMGYSNGSIQVSAPATSSLSATGFASISVNGSTISIGAAIPQLSFYQPLGPVQSTTVTQNGLGSVQIYPALAAFPFSASRVDMMASVSLSALVLSTQAQTLSMYVGLYSLNGSTLSLASSGSQSYAWTNSSNNSSASLSGMRRFSAPINVNYTGGFDLFIGLMSNTTFVNSNAISLSNVVMPLGPGPQLQGFIGQTQVNSMQFVPGQGFFSATSAALPSSIALSQISGAGSGGNPVDYYAPVQFVNLTA